MSTDPEYQIGDVVRVRGRATPNRYVVCSKMRVVETPEVYDYGVRMINDPNCFETSMMLRRYTSFFRGFELISEEGYAAQRALEKLGVEAQ